MERKKIRSECDFIGFKNNRLNYRCKECSKISTKSINELIEKLLNTNQFCNGDLNKFVMLLRKGLDPYEHTDSWEKFNEISLPRTKDCYRELTLEDISDKDYNHAETHALKYTDLILLIFILPLD